MKISITARHYTVTAELKEYITDRVSRFSKYSGRIDEAHVTLTEEKFRKMADVVFHMGKARIAAREESPDMRSAVDLALERAKTQMLKTHERVKGHKRKIVVDRLKKTFRGIFGAVTPEPLPVTQASGPRLVPTPERFAPKPMSVEEAMMELEVLPVEFIVFKNAQTGAVCVIYKMKERAYGLIEPQF